MAKVLISGASGLIGSAVARALEEQGHNVTRLVRRTADAGEVQWDPMCEISPELVSGFEAVVHLSGESVAGRWTGEKKRRIRESRVVSTRNLAWAMAPAAKKSQTFICASAIGYYGDCGADILTEESAAGAGFLAEVCREWEVATEPAMSAGIRVVNLRFGIVLSRDGGALKQMLIPFRLGLGGEVGSGRQWWSWIHIDDLVGTVLSLLDTRTSTDDDALRPTIAMSNINGPVNVVAPNPVTNAEFTKDLARAVRRPAFFRVPAFAAKLVFGEFAEEGMLASERVVPKKLVESGFEFRYRELAGALENLLR